MVIRNDRNGQLMNLESSETEILSEAEDMCEPANKRHKTQHDKEEEESFNTQLNINLFINNNVTIHKPS